MNLDSMDKHILKCCSEKYFTDEEISTDNLTTDDNCDISDLNYNAADLDDEEDVETVTCTDYTIAKVCHDTTFNLICFTA